MQTSQTEHRRPARFAAYIAARRIDPPRPLLVKAAGVAEPKDHALDAGAGALNASKYLLAAGFKHVTALDASPASQQVAKELPADQVNFVLARFEDFAFPASAYDLVNAEFSLPFIGAPAFPLVFERLLGSVKIGGLFTGQLFGPNDSWNVPESGMNFHSRSEVKQLLRGWTLLEFTEEDHPGTTKLGEDKHWHIFHIIARRTQYHAQPP
jgi:tellurite methyltransferase